MKDVVNTLLPNLLLLLFRDEDVDGSGANCLWDSSHSTAECGTWAADIMKELAPSDTPSSPPPAAVVVVQSFSSLPACDDDWR